MKWKLGLVVCSALVVSAANGGNLVRIWYKSDPNGATVFGDTVRIKAAGTYKIDAITTPGTALGYVNEIWIDPNGPAVDGDVYVYVVRNPLDAGGDTHSPGVTQLKEVNLTHVTANHSGTLVEVRCTSHLGFLGPIVATNVSDTLSVGGDVQHEIEITNDIVKAMTIHGHLNADLKCVSINDLTISGVGLSLAAPPNITIYSSYAQHMTVNQAIDTLTIAGAVDPNATIAITGSPNDLYNLQMPSGTGVIHGTVSVAAGRLRSASLEGIGETGTLSVARKSGMAATMNFT